MQAWRQAPLQLLLLLLLWRLLLLLMQQLEQLFVPFAASVAHGVCNG